MYRKDGPAEMAPVGEVEFVNGIAAMSASGNYGPCRVAEAIIGHADLTLGARRARGAGSRDRRRRRALPRHPPRCVVGRQRGDQRVRLSRGAAASGARPQIPRGLRPARAARPQLQILAVSSAIAGCDRPCPRLSRHHDHPQPCRRRARRRPLCRPPAGDPCRLEEGHRRTRQMPERQLSSSAASA